MRTLKDFASYIKKEQPEQFGKSVLRYSRQFNLPLLKLFEGMPEEQLVEMSVQGSLRFLTNLENDEALNVAMENLKKWEAGELEGVPRGAIHPSDLVFVYTSQKFALLDMLPLFTGDTAEASAIIKELEEYYAKAQDAAVQMMFKMHKESEEALREKDRTLAQFMEGLPIGIYIIDRNRATYFVNKTTRRLFGDDVGTVENREELFKLYKADSDVPYPVEDLPIVRALEGKHTTVDDMEVHMKDKIIPLEVWGIPVFDKNGNVTYAIAGFNDITERKKAQSEILKKTVELERSNKELEIFASVASHDLQEPLRTISSYLELLARKLGDGLDEDARSLMETAVDGSKRMRALINNLLEYSRITRATSPFQEIDVNQVFDEVLDNLKNFIHHSGAQITIDNEVSRIKGDHYQIVQLFQNLVSNGIKFQGGHKPEIVIKGRETRRNYEFSVKDNGIGIDPQYQHKIFEIFQRLNTRDKYPGTGIGLAICKKIVERHGGDIWMDSAGREGTTFYFTVIKN